jgi:serine/threonine-protein kinase
MIVSHGIRLEPSFPTTAKAASLTRLEDLFMENPEIKRFGRYEIVAELGRGAMGVVYKARDPQIDRIVAVKTVSLRGQEPEEEKEFRLRFTNEAQAAGRLHHSGIVSVFDVGEDPDNRDPYIILEYVSGESLQRILAREKKLSLSQALQLAREIAEALDYAHEQGVVHRDIKPGNILVTEDGHAKIADFGIAKLNLAHFTLPGRVLGTPAYMAPEQLSGEGSDGRSDLFSLGVILYAMVTGHSPFPGSSATTVCFRVANREPVAASALDLSLPPQLDAVISLAIAKNPEERYQRGSEFAADLRQLQEAYRPGSTTISLQAVPSLASRSAALRAKTASNVTHMAAVAQAEKVVHHIMFKAPLRDLILGAATVILLVILGVQFKLLGRIPWHEVNPSDGGVNQSEILDARNASSAPPTERPTDMDQPAPRTARSFQTKARVKEPSLAKEIVVPSATLELAIQHQFKDATLYLYVDDKLAHTRALHGGAQKKLVLFNGIKGVESETVKIPAGSHSLRLRAVSADQTTDLSKTLSADFAGGADKTLQVTFEKHNTVMRLAWQ